MGRNAPGTGLNLEQFSSETLRLDNVDDDVVEAAGRFLMAHVPAEGWFDNFEAGTWGVLDAVFGEVGKAKYHGSKPSQQWTSDRTEWLNKVRAFCAERGKPHTGSWVPRECQLAYEAATGDVWKPGKRKGRDFTPYRYPAPEGDAARAYRARVRAWGREQGRRVQPRGVIEGWLLNAYCDATGDVWKPVGVSEAA